MDNRGCVVRGLLVRGGERPAAGLSAKRRQRLRRARTVWPMTSSIPGDPPARGACESLKTRVRLRWTRAIYSARNTPPPYAVRLARRELQVDSCSGVLEHAKQRRTRALCRVVRGRSSRPRTLRLIDEHLAHFANSIDCCLRTTDEHLGMIVCAKIRGRGYGRSATIPCSGIACKVALPN